jgi:hypothetical protein
MMGRQLVSLNPHSKSITLSLESLKSFASFASLQRHLLTALTANCVDCILESLNTEANNRVIFASVKHTTNQFASYKFFTFTYFQALPF